MYCPIVAVFLLERMVLSLYIRLSGGLGGILGFCSTIASSAASSILRSCRRLHNRHFGIPPRLARSQPTQNPPNPKHKASPCRVLIHNKKRQKNSPASGLFFILKFGLGGTTQNVMRVCGLSALRVRIPRI